ncbi:MAG: NADH-quinone oxidoreductase subunit B [bacterium]|nr:NADH-quinone oxidoreductase subunit B [bacterium]
MGSLKPASENASQEAGFLATRADELINWGRKNSLWPMPLGLSCCGIELMAMIGPKFDIARFGAEAARFSPRQCDLLVVAGTLTWKMAQACRTIYDQMPDPKWVLAMGVCSSSGGMYDSYAVVQGVDMLLPVDVYVPGCPPRPDAVIDAILKLQKKIERESPTRVLSGNRPELSENGTGKFNMAPNDAVQTRRIGTYVPTQTSGEPAEEVESR